MPLAQPPPRISIITINLNNSQGLEKTVKSLEKQTWRNFESIIIDGGSNDKSMSVIKEAHRSLCLKYQRSGSAVPMQFLNHCVLGWE